MSLYIAHLVSLNKGNLELECGAVEPSEFFGVKVELLEESKNLKKNPEKNSNPPPLHFGVRGRIGCISLFIDCFYANVLDFHSTSGLGGK